ncbi:tyrosine-type recombinase/integrase [Burkholderia cenocepacia]|uniref:tyrosine-type recombinase/integrase n=1 Tax=Burkholderia cenocepacia TaxID=95486 RepID=UPI003211B8E1
MYADYEQGNRTVLALATFRHVAERYLIDVLPGKAPETRRTNLLQLEKLYSFFDSPPAPLDDIKPIHIRKYLDWRKTSPVSANREIALFSHIFNKAREWGATDRPNPCAGVRKHRETGRDVYVGDDLYKCVWEKADLPLREAMDLAYLTGQRPADVLKMDERDVRDGVISIRQNKTGARLRIEVVGDLAALLTQLTMRKCSHNPRSTRLIVDEQGRPLGRAALRFRFDRARDAAGIAKDDFQFRDLRAKAGTDKESSDDIREAQALLGHGSVTMTEHYVRKRGRTVLPTK